MENNKIEELRKNNLEKRILKEQRQKQREENKNKKINVSNEQGLEFSKKFNEKKLQNLKNKKDVFNAKHKKIDEKLNELIKENSKSENSKKISFFNRLVISFNQRRIKRLENSFKRKKEKVNFKLKIAKITEEKAKDDLDKLNIDESLKISALEKRVQQSQNYTKKQILANALVKNQKNLDLKLQNISITEKRKFVPNYIKLISSSWSIFKTNTYIFNLSIDSIFKKISGHFRKYSMYYILAFILGVFAMTTDLKNLNPENVVTVFSSNTYILIIGLGMLLVIVGGYIDLSVGAMLGFVGALSVQIYNQFNGNILLTLIFTIAFGMAFGLFQGFLIGYLKMPAFIVTLGGMLLFQGLLLTITDSKTLMLAGNSSYVEFVKASMPDVKVGNLNIFSFLIIFLGGLASSLLMFLGRQTKYRYGIALDGRIAFLIKQFCTIALFTVFAYMIGSSARGLQYYMIWIIALVVFFIFLTQNTTFGRKVFAMGGNKKAAALSGINTKLTTVYIFMIIGALASFAAIIHTGEMVSATPSAGSGYELDVISSVFVGGASMQGGVGNVPGTVIGGLILGFINNGMNLMNYAADLQKLLKL